MNDKPHENNQGDLEDPPPWWREWWHKLSDPGFVYKWAFTLGVVLLIVHGRLSNIDSQKSMFGYFVLELGIAYVVAAILGCSIESYNKHRNDLQGRQFINAVADHAHALIREIEGRNNTIQQEAFGRVQEMISLVDKKHEDNKLEFSRKIAGDMIEAAYGSHIPAEVIRAAVQYILKTKKVRHDCETTIEIHRLSEFMISEFGHKYLESEARLSDDEKVLLRYTTSWWDENATDFTEDMEFVFQIIMARDRRAMVTGPTYLQIGDHVMKGEAEIRDGAIVVDGDESNGTAGRTTVTYPKKCVGSRERTLVKWSYNAIHDSEDTHVMMLLAPCVSVLMNVTVADHLLLEVASIHPEDEVLQTVDIHNPKCKSWRLKSASLPAWGFLIDWRPKEGGCRA